MSVLYKKLNAFFFNSGSHLLSRAVSSKVPSAAWVLTIVFGMGTGVTPRRIATGNIQLFSQLMGLSGLEPPTSRLSGVRSNRLSYKPIICSHIGRLYESVKRLLFLTGDINLIYHSYI